LLGSVLLLMPKAVQLANPAGGPASFITGLPFREGLHAASHAVLNVLPLYLLCNPTDVGTGACRAYPWHGRKQHAVARLPACPVATAHTPAALPPRPTPQSPFLACLACSLAECDSPFDTRFRPERLLIYDKHPGGIGLAAAVRSRGPYCRSHGCDAC
jgi:DEAD/DEAH box helicase domain-containing protein